MKRNFTKQLFKLLLNSNHEKQDSCPTLEEAKKIDD